MRRRQTLKPKIYTRFTMTQVRIRYCNLNYRICEKIILHNRTKIKAPRLTGKESANIKFTKELHKQTETKNLPGFRTSRSRKPETERGGEMRLRLACVGFLQRQKFERRRRHLFAFICIHNVFHGIRAMKSTVTMNCPIDPRESWCPSNGDSQRIKK